MTLGHTMVSAKINPTAGHFACKFTFIINAKFETANVSFASGINQNQI
jgi:hypothetical protein